MIKECRNSAFNKTEELLRNYSKFQYAVNNNFDNTKKTKRLIKIINIALKSIENDKYYPIIELIYFENKTREEVAEIFDCEVKTIARNKNRLINILKPIIFSDRTIEEIFM